jgi:hypothetical protein
MEKRIRSEAQKESDKKYQKKIAPTLKTVCFRMKVAEAERVESVIKGAGLSKVEFLRRAVEAFNNGKFE